MKKKNIIIIAGAILTVGILAVAGISMFKKANNNIIQQNKEPLTWEETLDLIQRNEQIEIEIAIPENIEQGTEKQLTWIQLYDLDNYQDTLRTPMEHAANQGYYVNPEMKDGVFYHNNLNAGTIDKNNTLKKIFAGNYSYRDAFTREETIQAFADAAFETYADLEEDDTMTNYYMALNGYFNILPDTEPAYANPESILTRAEFMSAMFRGETPVDDSLEVNEDFVSAVGESQYNLYAQAIAEDAYLNLLDSSLNEKTYNGTISRAEAVYLVMNHYFKDELANFDVSTVESSLEDVKDGGDIATAQGYVDKQYGTSYEISYYLNNPDEGAPSDIYKALVLAEQKGLIDSETRADEALTKVEAIELLVNVYKQASATQGEIEEVEDSLTQDTETEDESPSDTFEIPDYVDLTEDTNGDGIISYKEDMSDGIDGYTVHYNDDGSNTTYIINQITGQIVHPGEYYTTTTGESVRYFGVTPEDEALAWSKI